ncbi:kinase-like domain-containing protein [Pavlovales sp. CCMP2436]|nr:kinase-like domain-containing protein [Pavlovales sp. CCMP2436]
MADDMAVPEAHHASNRPPTLVIDDEGGAQAGFSGTPVRSSSSSSSRGLTRRWLSPDPLHREGSPSDTQGEYLFARDGLPRYRRLALLGQGSQGTAYLVADIMTEARYVLKKIPVSRSGGDQVGKNEASALAALRHPSIVRFEAAWQDAGGPSGSGAHLILMEYVDGGTLRELIERAGRREPDCPRPSESELLDWASHLLLALAHAHRRGLLHRDIKPSNLLITHAGVLKLIDFGAARELSGEDALARTCIGTPYYLAPEVIEGKGYDSKADVWATGVVLYQAAELRLPFAADNLPGLALKILSGNFVPLDAGYSDELHSLIRRCLVADPALRPSAEELLASPALVQRAAAFVAASVDSSPGWLAGERTRALEVNVNDSNSDSSALTLPSSHADSRKTSPEFSEQLAEAPAASPTDPAPRRPPQTPPPSRRVSASADDLPSRHRPRIDLSESAVAFFAKLAVTTPPSLDEALAVLNVPPSESSASAPAASRTPPTQRVASSSNLYSRARTAGDNTEAHTHRNTHKITLFGLGPVFNP